MRLAKPLCVLVLALATASTAAAAPFRQISWGFAGGPVESKPATAFLEIRQGKTVRYAKSPRGPLLPASTAQAGDLVPALGVQAAPDVAAIDLPVGEGCDPIADYETWALVMDGALPVCDPPDMFARLWPTEPVDHSNIVTRIVYGPRLTGWVPVVNPMPELGFVVTWPRKRALAFRPDATYRCALARCLTLNTVYVLRRGRVVRSVKLGYSARGAWRWDKKVRRNGTLRPARPGRYVIRLVASGYLQKHVAQRAIRVRR